MARQVVGQFHSLSKHETSGIKTPDRSFFLQVDYCCLIFSKKPQYAPIHRL